VSLNWKEIDLVLEELDLEGSLIQDIHQPLHDRLVLSLFKAGRHFDVVICLSPRHPRLHILMEKLTNPAKPFRFAAFLRAHVKGGRIVSTAQCGRERIVRMVVRRAEEEEILWLRLWGSAANAIVTDSEGTILDAFYRRPKRGEISGGRFDGEAPPAARQEKEYEVREIPGQGSFNERLEAHFREMETLGDADRTRTEIETALGIHESKVLANLEKLEKRLSDYTNLARWKELGDLITSSLHLIGKGERWVRVEDFFHGNALVDIELKPDLTPAQNAEACYEKYRKARDGMGKVTEEIAHLRGTLAGIEAQRRAVAEAVDLGAIAGLRQTATHGKSAQPDAPGLVFESGPFRILVGRTGKENEELLRRAVRGNDWWFHARDWPGAYVFVKAPQGKSIPLETMLDAASLAIHFSKGKTSGGGDVYYTQVKYLRKIKGAKRGLVIPTREKNIRVSLDEGRVERMKETKP
jgi:predicted ribosome quality control (RQC) complex YloA/Tae2 family protein